MVTRNFAVYISINISKCNVKFFEITPLFKAIIFAKILNRMLKFLEQKNASKVVKYDF